MVKGIAVSDSQMKIKQFLITGRKLPTKNEPNPGIYKMRVFAKNEILAKSKFWYFLKRQKKVKKANGEILAVSEIFEKNVSNVKNYGLVVRYRSRTGIHNMYKEYRDVSVCGAVSQMYMEMSGRHRAVHDTIHIVKAATVETPKLRRQATIVNAAANTKFPKISSTYRASSKGLRSTFVAGRPNTTIA
eukprot:CAMPEP_0168323612 /NCGR_PEP_ID=MMETSP0213-20121227/3582_1 /TAXON_ID=151035 /ORGANISM="Euplotes harpa, Strain FSP1.4" /LENGTH=187 /DNA_ID=CAMNT_0008325711 /DNA_START=31 /DNA_END=594 /DNA_ORIENTATION=+